MKTAIRRAFCFLFVLLVLTSGVFPMAFAEGEPITVTYLGHRLEEDKLVFDVEIDNGTGTKLSFWGAKLVFLDAENKVFERRFDNYGEARANTQTILAGTYTYELSVEDVGFDPVSVTLQGLSFVGDNAWDERSIPDACFYTNSGTTSAQVAVEGLSYQEIQAQEREEYERKRAEEEAEREERQAEQKAKTTKFAVIGISVFVAFWTLVIWLIIRARKKQKAAMRQFSAGLGISGAPDSFAGIIGATFQGAANEYRAAQQSAAQNTQVFSAGTQGFAPPAAGGFDAPGQPYTATTHAQNHNQQQYEAFLNQTPDNTDKG